MTRISIARNLVDAVTKRLVPKSCYVTSVVVNASAGTTQTLKIQDRGGSVTPAQPVKTLVGPVTLSLPGPGTGLLYGKFELFNDAVVMVGGVDAITTGTGVVDVWVNALMKEEE